MDANEITSVFETQVVTRVRQSKPRPRESPSASWCHVSLWLSGLPVPLTLVIKGTDAIDVSEKAVSKMCSLSGERMRVRAERSDVRWGYIRALHEPPDETLDLTANWQLEATETEQAS